MEKKLEVLEVSRVFMVQIQRWDDFGRKSQRSISLPEFLDLSDGITEKTVQEMTDVGAQRDILTQF